MAAVPWVTTTPTRNVATITSPGLETPPHSDKKAVADKVATLKQALKEKGVDDTAILEQLEAIESATKEAPVQPGLSHKTLNQLQKAEKAFEGLKTQLKDLDTQWKAWQDYMMKKFEEQAGHYQEKRKVLLEKLTEAKTKVVALRSEIKQAALARQQVDVVEVDTFTAPEVVDFGAHQIQVHDISDEEMDDTKANKLGTARSRSPSRVTRKS